MVIERKIGPHSRPGRLAVVDGRSAEAKLMKQIRADLTRHCGGAPSATQRMLIERCATLSLRIHLLDRDIMKAGGMSEKNAREYLCWTNSLSRLLRQLGLEAAPARQPDIRDVIAAHRRPAAP